MTKNRLKAKGKVLAHKVAGEVIMDVMSLYHKLVEIDSNGWINPQVLKNTIGIIRKQYKDQMSTMPVEEKVQQRDIETAIKDAKEGKY